MMHRHPIHWIGSKPADHYACVPNALARDGKLSPVARSVAMFLWSHAEDFEVSQKSIADSLGLDRGTARRALEDLSGEGWLAIRKLTPNSWEFYAHPARKLTEDEHAEFSSTTPCGKNPQGDAGNSSRGMRENAATTLRENAATKKTIQENQQEKQQERETRNEYDGREEKSPDDICPDCECPYSMCDHYETIWPPAQPAWVGDDEEPPF